MKPSEGRGWAWMLEDGSICHWADPERKQLVSNGRPSPSAKPVYVRIIPVRRRKVTKRNSR